MGKTISKLPTKENKSKYKYRFKFENIGKRNIIDIEVIVRLRIKGLKPDLPRNWEVIYLPTTALEYKKIAIIRPVSKTKIRPVLEIKTYECDYFQKEFFPSEIKEKSQNGTLTLEEVMQLGTKSEFQILIFGTDTFSGARKFFESKFFGKGDIIEGYFDRNGVEVQGQIKK
ncbi:MAG: hypothetical protein LBR36_01445 [Bacteroidales bacterium]|nr:hypothetical protein [Bacteroidales bacterium]